MRLMWAYRDVLRNHVPFVTRWYIKRFRRSQMEAARRLRGKDRIEVAFMLTIPGMWKSDYLFRAMQENPRYHPYVVIYPYSWYKGFSREEVEATLHRTEKFISDKGFEYVMPRDKKTGRWQDIKKTLDPDILIFSSPYKDQPSKYFVYHFRDRLTCYVPYGFGSLKMFQVNYNTIFHNLVGLYFVETEIHYDLAERYARNKGANAVVTGFPGTEVFLRKDYVPMDVWKHQSRPKKRVIWAPHHTIDDTYELSTFLLRCDDMMMLSKRYKDEVQFVFKPHPLLKFKLQQLWGEYRVNEYYNYWAGGENTQLEESSYVDLFLTSDAMLHDCGSFTSEYLFTLKPVMYLTHDEKVRDRLGPFGLLAFDCHYRGDTMEEIERFLQQMVIKGDDPKRQAREAFFEQYLQPVRGVLPSQKIIKTIEQTINS